MQILAYTHAHPPRHTTIIHVNMHVANDWQLSRQDTTTAHVQITEEEWPIRY